MILLNREIDKMTDADVLDTLAYAKKELSEWNVFRQNTNDFQMRNTADNNIIYFEKLIKKLSERHS